MPIDQCNWKNITFQSHKKDSKKSEADNKVIMLNEFYVPPSSKETTYFKT